MSETPDPGAPPAAPLPAPVKARRTRHTPERDGQLVVSLAIVTALAVITVALILAGGLTGHWEFLGTGIGTGIGALATALNAPTGITSALRASRKEDHSEGGGAQ